ncbi:MAG: hypothetical protein JRI80_05890 [Deltaproteobacteria bacterium]|nr:hypothetical protein [Deltaproteobacteria bacterium]
MKIKVKSEKIIKAVKKMYGIEIELETTEDATDAISLILRKMSDTGQNNYKQLKEIGVTSSKQYETSSVDYELTFLLSFLFEEDVPLETRVAVIKDFQEFFARL